MSTRSAIQRKRPAPPHAPPSGNLLSAAVGRAGTNRSETRSTLLIGNNSLQTRSEHIHGALVTLWDEPFYRITNYDQMPPFFMTVVSSGDQWMFVSSTGALTAGRGNPDLALFPYYPEDRIHDSAEFTGSKTLLIVRSRGRNRYWEPFSERYQGVYRVVRSLYRSLWGNNLVFEETNCDLELSFRYGWLSSDRFGFVRKASLTQCGSNNTRVTLLDGVQNLMPTGSTSQFQLEKSPLLDAYKQSELLPETGLALFRLSSIPLDRPEPAEALRTMLAWSLGLGLGPTLLSSRQLSKFRRGLPIETETDLRGQRGAYFRNAELNLSPGEEREWLIVADVNRGPSEVVAINHLLRAPGRLQRLIDKDVHRGTQELQRIAASADGLQKTADPLRDARHFSNILFNTMRGGVFRDGYRIDPADLQTFIRDRNQDVAARHAALLNKLPSGIHHRDLLALAAETGDANLERLCREYLPLTFSRRHGDPSRPWNRFNIPPKTPDGSRTIYYEGNWRDIFQNWEALAISFPGYAASMVCTFVNACTADGYNPYRISREGIDWEVADSSNPWSHIGYWGDHQIIYLLKLLEILQRHDPATLRGFLCREIFCYANIPYRIKLYEALIENPKETVAYDTAADELVRQRVHSRGADGKLVWDRQGQVLLVNLAEKLLVLLLAKFSNFVPEGGIWLNTQRPEWNDANNALVGHGVSMVTLYYLRRFLAFCLESFKPLELSDISLSEEVARLALAVCRTLERYRPLPAHPLDDTHRRRIFEHLGRDGSRYREAIYSAGFSGRKQQIRGTRLLHILSVMLEYTDTSIRANRRPDGLYHSYNLISFDNPSALPIRRLYEMLEGQVAVLSSGCLSPEESVRLLRDLKQSAMYRADQHSYLLYPDRRLPRFLERNILSQRDVARSELLQKLIADNDRSLVERDVSDQVHFSGSVSNARDVLVILEQLGSSGYARLVKSDTPLILDIFERLFDHRSFTGRSDRFFGYEGLGCIYWHMVSKLLLAAQEAFFRADEACARPHLLRELAECYYDIRAGIGDRKAPEVYGGFPMEPYSHTPAHAGARQPGLTGQVKEDILCRMGELGVFVQGGEIRFRPLLVRPEEFLKYPADFRYYDTRGAARRLRLAAGSLAFTYCQVPIVYRLGERNALAVVPVEGPRLHSLDLRLDLSTSRLILDRAGTIHRVEVELALGRDARSDRGTPKLAGAE